MEKFRFLKWKVYKEAKELVSLVLATIKKLPREYRFELSSQIIRSSFSIVLNIAEGSGKTSDRELNRYIEIALDSINETLSAADVLKDEKLIKQEDFDEIYKSLKVFQISLEDLRKSLINN